MKRINTILGNEHGISGIVFTVSLGMLVGIAAITLDIGRAFVTRGELQNIADSAALAAGQQLGQQYKQVAQNNNNVIPDGFTADEAQMEAAAQSLSTLHAAGGKMGMNLDTDDIVVGQWNIATSSVNVGAVAPDAVSVQSRRDGNVNGPLATFFAKALPGNYATMNVTRTATAALGPVTTAPPGTVNAPFGISEQWFKDGGQCNDVIRFSPANDPLACAGWHVFDEVTLGSTPNNPAHCDGGGIGGGGGGGTGDAGVGSANAQLLRNIIDCIARPGDQYASPEVTAGETQFDFTNGEDAAAFSNLEDLYDAKKDENDEWHVMIPIYESTDCLGPVGPTTIVGFASAVVYNVDVDNRIIDARVECNTIIPDGRSGAPGAGGGLAPLGTIPNLVS